jgi:predicted secreted protein
MKSYIFFAGFYILLLLLAIGCDRTSATTEPATSAVLPEVQTIDIPLDEFVNNPDMEKDITLVKPGSLIVKLGANPTTGYQWNQTMENTVIKEISHDYLGPEATKIVGVGGVDVWVFDSLDKGAAVLNFSYGRPWEGGEKGTYTLTINITVK